jgi:hypothetical protein
MKKRTKRVLLVMLLFAMLGTISNVYSNMFRYCPNESCYVHACWCQGDYIEDYYLCCFSCWTRDQVTGEWIIFYCCGQADGCHIGG